MEDKCRINNKTGQEIKEAVNFLKVISEENRLKMICVLKKRELCVCDIWRYMDLPQNLVSHHLKVLKDFGLLRSRRDGTKIIYSFNSENFKKFSSLLSRFID